MSTSTLELIAHAKEIALKGVQINDGHTYNVHAHDLVDYAETILALVQELEAQHAVRPAPEPEWEYGWRSFFNGTAEEYEWLDCGSREEAERQIALFQETEDRTRTLRRDDSEHLTYSLWRRRVTQPGPWESVPEPTEGETR